MQSIYIQLNSQKKLIAMVITKRSIEDLGLMEGGEVIVSFKAVAIHLIK